MRGFLIAVSSAVADLDEKSLDAVIEKMRKWQQETVNPMQVKPTRVFLICTKCDGYGETVDQIDEPCSRCKGTGYEPRVDRSPAVSAS